MVEVQDIVDRDGLLAWLEGQPRVYSEIIAHRAAMRVLPIFLEWQSLTGNKSLGMIVLGANLVSSVVIQSSLQKRAQKNRFNFSRWVKLIRNASGEVRNSKNTKVYTPSDWHRAVAIISAAATAIDGNSGPNSSRIAAALAVDTSASLIEFSGSLIRFEADILSGTGDLKQRSIWQAHVNPFGKSWTNVKAQWQADVVDWSFWIKWYDAVLDGEPQNHEMLEKIALIPPEDWEQGPAHVNKLIAEIEEAFLLAATPVAEKVELNPDTKRLRIVPERMSQKALYGNLLEVIRDGMADLRDSPQFDNALSALGPVFEKVLDRTFSKYLSSPQRVHDDFVKAKRRIQKLLDVGEVAPNDEVVEFVDDLDAGAAHIRANMPQVRDGMAALAALRIAEASDADIEGIKAGAEAIAAQSEPEMAEEMRNDAAELVASRDVPMGAPKLLAPDVAYRLGHRIVESKQVLTKANVIKAGGVSAATFTGSQMIIEAVRAILRLFGI